MILDILMVLMAMAFLFYIFIIEPEKGVQEYEAILSGYGNIISKGKDKK